MKNICGKRGFKVCAIYVKVVAYEVLTCLYGRHLASRYKGEPESLQSVFLPATKYIMLYLLELL